MRTSVLLPLAVAVFLVLGDARAEPDPAKLQAAAEEFDEGTKLFKRKEYEEAAAHFETADRYAPSPAALSNAIRARRSARQFARAATLAAQAAARYPDDKTMSDLAREIFKAQEKQLGKLDVSCSPACTLVLDGKVASAEPVASFVLYVDPGPHTVVAGWPGDRSRSNKIEGKKGEASPLAFTAPPEEKKAPPPPPLPPPDTAPPPPPPPPAAKGLPPWVVFAGAGATVVVTGVAIWSGLDTKSSPGVERVRAECAGQPASCPAFAEGKSKERRTDALFITAGVLGVATGVVAGLFTNWRGESPPPATGVRVAPTVSIGREMNLGVAGVF